MEAREKMIRNEHSMAPYAWMAWPGVVLTAAALFVWVVLDLGNAPCAVATGVTVMAFVEGGMLAFVGTIGRIDAVYKQRQQP